MKIENRIKELRIKNNLSFEEFAAIGAVSERSQRMYENGKTTPSIEYCAEIAKFFKIDLNWLLTGEGTMLKGGVAGNESFSDEDVKLLKLIKALAPEQKNDTVKDLEKFVRWNQSAISHFLASNQGEQQRAAA